MAAALVPDSGLTSLTSVNPGTQARIAS